MSTTFVGNQVLVTITCCNCAVLFAMPQEWYSTLRKTHQFFYCPAGHSQHYPEESEEEKLKRQVAQLQTSIKHKDAVLVRVREQRDHLDRSRNAIRGVLTRTCKRIKNGVCPCCNRTFANLASHMQTQHPKYQDKDDAGNA